MYDGLPKTGVAIGAGGQIAGLSWLLAIGAMLVIAGILFARYGKSREHA